MDSKKKFYAIGEESSERIVGSFYETIAFSYVSDVATGDRHTIVDHYDYLDGAYTKKAVEEITAAEEWEEYVEDFMYNHGISYTNGSAAGLEIIKPDDIDGLEIIYVLKKIKLGS